MHRRQSKGRLRRGSSHLLVAASMAAVALIARQQQAGAQTPATWTGGGSTPNWGDANNWSSSAGLDDPPVNGDDLYFTGGTTSVVVNADSTGSVSNLLTSVNSISFNFNNSGNGFTVNAFSNSTALTVGAGGITNELGFSQVINQDLAVEVNQTWNSGSPPGTMTYGNVSLGSGVSLTLAGTSSHSISGGLILGGSATVVNNGAAADVIGSNGNPGLTGSSTYILTLDEKSSSAFNLYGSPTFTGTIDFTNSGNGGGQDVLSWSTPFSGTILVNMGSGSVGMNNTTALGSGSTVVITSGSGYFSPKAGASIGTLSIGGDGSGYFACPNGGSVTVTQLLTTGGSVNNNTFGIAGSGATNSIVSIAGGNTFAIHNADYLTGTFTEGVVVNGIHFAYYSTHNSDYSGGMTLTGHGASFNWGNAVGGTGAFGSLTGAGTFLIGTTPTDTNPLMNFASLASGGVYATSPNQIYSGFASINSGSGTFVLSSGSTLLPGYNGTTGVLKFSSSTGFLSIQGGSSLTYNLAGTPSQASVAGGFTWSTLDPTTPGPSDLETLNVTGATIGTYDLIAYASLTGGAIAGMDVTNDFSILGLTGGDTGDLTLQANDLQLVVSAPVPEPVGISVLSLGAVGLLGRRRRRRSETKATEKSG